MPAAAAAGGGGAAGAEAVAEQYGVAVEELLDFAEYSDVDPATEPYLLPIVAENMNAPLPDGWSECYDEASGQEYYYNTASNETSWEHPLDQYYKNLMFMERKHQQSGAGGGAVAAEEVVVDSSTQEDYYSAEQPAPLRAPKRKPRDDELNFEKQLLAADQIVADVQLALRPDAHRAHALHEGLLARLRSGAATASEAAPGPGGAGGSAGKEH